MFTTPEMRAILDQIDAIYNIYPKNEMFPPFTQEQLQRLKKLHEAYQMAKNHAGL